MGWRTAFESVSDNPYLPDFYADMKKWSFHLQIFFLGHRAEQHLEMFEDSQSAIIDRSIYEDAYIFVRALHSMGNISERDYRTYRRVFDLVVKNLPTPSLLIYLKAPVDTLLKRINSRGREIESSISADYLKLLESFYDDWIAHYDLSPVLTLKTDDLDFVHKPKHLDTVVARIQDKLSGKEELIF
jgi:deoxyadenosine/deoxycytidine kinase